MCAKNGWKKQYSKNESIFKIPKNGHNAKAIAHAKSSVWVKKKLPKTCEKRFYKHIKAVPCKKRLEKAANIQKMRPFSKVPKIATMQRVYIAHAQYSVWVKK